MAQQDGQQARTDPQALQEAQGPKPAPDEDPQTRRSDWIGWVIMILAFLVVNCFLQIYCYWVFLPYPRW